MAGFNADSLTRGTEGIIFIQGKSKGGNDSINLGDLVRYILKSNCQLWKGGSIKEFSSINSS